MWAPEVGTHKKQIGNSLLISRVGRDGIDNASGGRCNGCNDTTSKAKETSKVAANNYYKCRQKCFKHNCSSLHGEKFPFVEIHYKHTWKHCKGFSGLRRTVKAKDGMKG